MICSSGALRILIRARTTIEWGWDCLGWGGVCKDRPMPPIRPIFGCAETFLGLLGICLRVALYRGWLIGPGCDSHSGTVRPFGMAWLAHCSHSSHSLSLLHSAASVSLLMALSWVCLLIPVSIRSLMVEFTTKLLWPNPCIPAL